MISASLFFLSSRALAQLSDRMRSMRASLEGGTDSKPGREARDGGAVLVEGCRGTGKVYQKELLVRLLICVEVGYIPGEENGTRARAGTREERFEGRTDSGCDADEKLLSTPNIRASKAGALGVLPFARSEPAIRKRFRDILGQFYINLTTNRSK